MKTLFVGLLLWTSAAHADGWKLPVVYVEKVEISGNQKTKDSEVRRLSALEIGDELTPSMVTAARKRILSSPVFEAAEIDVSKGSAGDKAVVTIRVKEKFSWFVVPNFSYSSSGFGGGLAYGETNFLGMLKQILIAGNFSSLNRTAILGFRDPSVGGTSMVLAIDGIYRWDTMLEYDDGDETRRMRLTEYGATVMPGIRWSPTFTTSLGVAYRRVKQRLIRETAGARTLDPYAFKRGNDIAITAQFQFADSTNVEGQFEGYDLSLEGQISDNRFFSDYEYFKQLLRFKMGHSFWGNRLNFVNNTSAQFGRTLPYYRELMIGGDNLRGYKSREFRGDTRYSSSQELMVPLYRFKRVITRLVFFWDTAVIYFKDDKFSRDAWRNGVGGGIRAYFKGISIPLVGYDLGYGIEQKSFEHYVNVGVTF